MFAEQVSYNKNVGHIKTSLKISEHVQTFFGPEYAENIYSTMYFDPGGLTWP